MTNILGYLLTRHWRDSPSGIELSFWAWTSSGPLQLLFPNQPAVCFVAAASSLPPVDCERRAVPLKDPAGQAVHGLYFKQQSILRHLRQSLAADSLELLESDIKPTDRFLMERFITAGFEAQGVVEAVSGYARMVNPKLRSAAVEPELSHVSLDIETDGLEGAVISIAFSGNRFAVVHMLGKENPSQGGPSIRWYQNEKSLLQGALTHLNQLDPDIILGWNLVNFDLTYLQRRCRHHDLQFTLGRAGTTAAIIQPRVSGQRRIASIPGRVALDGIDNLRAAFWSFESFSLGQVARQLLGQNKLIEESKDKIEEIRRLFREDKPGLAAYNLEDSRLVEKIFAKSDLINFCVQRSAMTGLALGRQGGSVAAFDNLYLPRLHRRGYVARDVGARSYSDSSPGGYVMDSKPGIYENVLVLDFKSLYPSIIRTFKIDPLGMAQPGPDPIPGYLGACFSREENILPEIIATLWKQRDAAKRANNQALSQAIKILMNSFYGVLGSSGCRFYNPQLASSITRRGHHIITRSRDWLEDAGYPVIYGDTDSLFVLLGPDKDEVEAKQTGRRLAEELNDWWRNQLREELKLKSYLEIEFETHFIRFLMPTIRGSETGSKKRYAGYVRTKTNEFEIRFKGLESVRSDWTPLARRFQQELYRRIFFDEPYRDYVKKVVLQLRTGALNNQLVYRKRLRRPLDQYRRNQPPHVQAARKSKRLGRHVSYIITVNGPEPTDSVSSPIDYQHYIDRQLAPAADGILHFLDDSFAQIVDDQMVLF